jgi:hypothetical protein
LALTLLGTIYGVAVNGLGNKKLVYFRNGYRYKHEKLENSMESHKVYPEMFDMCSISLQTTRYLYSEWRLEALPLLVSLSLMFENISRKNCPSISQRLKMAFHGLLAI